MKKSIGLIYRSKDRQEQSIEAIFYSIMPYLNKKYEVEELYVPNARYNSLFSLIENIKATRNIDCDVLHITGEVYFVALSIPKNNSVITFHDFSHLDEHKGIMKLISWIFFHYIPFKKAKRIVCVSNTIKDQVIQKFPFTKNKVSVIPTTINDEYVYHPKAFNTTKPTILLVGTRWNKNVDRIIEAVKDIECNLTIIGKLDISSVELLKTYNIEYYNVHHISNDEVLSLYIESDMLCFPSLYEGFGRPIIEANAIGRPVITSDIQPMIEVANNSAYLVNPYDVESINSGIQKVIDDECLRNQMISKGLENAEQYRTYNVAKEYIKLYESILDGIER